MEPEPYVAPEQMAWFDYRKDYSATTDQHVPFVAGYQAALQDLGLRPRNDYPTS